VLSASELSDMRDIEELAMSSTAIIQRYTLTSDGMGGYSEAWANVGTVTCDLWPINQRGDREGVSNGGQPISKANWYVTVPFDTTITAKDRVSIDSRTFEVIFVPNSESWLTAKRVEARSLNEEIRL
jgi:head-tail adaptor